MTTRPTNKANGKVIVVIPAYNERNFAWKLLDSLSKIKQAGIIHEIVVIDDGSKDDTAKVARRRGATVVRLRGFFHQPKNYGKAYAFYKGAEFARENGANTIITLDADYVDIKSDQIQRLLEPLKEPAVKMTIGTLSEDISSLSGQRAIRMKALDPLFRQNAKWKTYFGLPNKWFRRKTGYGLETALNILLGAGDPDAYGYLKDTHTTRIVDTQFHTSRPARELKLQQNQIQRMNAIASERTRIAEQLRLNRAKARETAKPNQASVQKNLKKIRAQHLAARRTRR